jgi:hypothetical protein
MGFAFPLFLADGILFKSEPRGNERASKIRSLLRKMDGCKQHGTVRKMRNTQKDVWPTKREREREENNKIRKLIKFNTNWSGWDS